MAKKGIISQNLFNIAIFALTEYKYSSSIIFFCYKALSILKLFPLRYDYLLFAFL